MSIVIYLAAALFTNTHIAEAGDSFASAYFLEQANDCIWTSNLNGSGRTSFLTLSSNPWDIDFDFAANKIYWTQSDKVMRANLDGTGSEVIWSPGTIGLKGIAIDGAAGKLYFLEQATDSLLASNLDGSNRFSLIKLSSNPWDIDLDLADGKIYWTQSDKVMRANLDGTNPEILWAPGAIGLKGITVDGAAGKIYFQEQATDSILISNLDGSERTTLVKLNSNPWDIDIDIEAEKIYWTQSGKVMRANLNGTNPEILWAPGAIGLKGIAVIPEPSTVLLIGLGGAILFRRRRN